MNLSTVSASFPNSAFALDDQIVAKVIQLVGSVRPDLETILVAALNAQSEEAREVLAALIDQQDTALVLDVMRSVYCSYGLHLCDCAEGPPN